MPFDDADPLRDLSARVSVGTPLIKVPLRFAAGVYNLAFDSDDGGTVLFREITSPAVGFTLEDIRVNDMIDISAGFLWLTASAQDDGMDAAFTGDLPSSSTQRYREPRRLKPILSARNRLLAISSIRQPQTERR